MNKSIWKLIGEWSYFLGNVLVEVRVAFLLDCHLVLSLLKHKGVGVFLNKKIRNPNRGSPLNNSIDASLLDCPLVLSLLKHKGVGTFLN